LALRGKKGGFVDTIPLPVEIESAIPACPNGQLTSLEDDEKLNALASNNQHVMVVGNSNLRLISVESSKTIKDTLSTSSTPSIFLQIQLKFPNLLTASN